MMGRGACDFVHGNMGMGLGGMARGAASLLPGQHIKDGRQCDSVFSAVHSYLDSCVIVGGASRTWRKSRRGFDGLRVTIYNV